MKKRIYPSWRYHKTEQPKIIHSHEEHVALGNAWADSPQAFKEPVADAEQTPSTGEAESSPEDVPVSLGKRSKKELAEMAEELGYNEEDLAGKTKDELIEMIKDIES